MCEISPSTNILITGASGYIGGQLARALRQRQVPVRCLVRSTSNVETLTDLGCELVYGDIMDLPAVRQAVDGMDLVFHAAGVTKALDDRKKLLVNGMGTAHVARACAEQQQSPKHVYLSSVSAVGPVRVAAVSRQRRRHSPVSYYGYSKQLGEIEAEKYADQVPTVIVRPGVVFGEENQEMLPVFQTIDRLGCHLVPGYRPPKLSVIYIHDLVEILIRASQIGQTVDVAERHSSDSPRGYYFAVADEHPNYWQLGRLIQQALGRPRVIPVYIPPMTSWLLGLFADLVSRMRGQSVHLSVDKMRDAMVSSWEYCPTAVRRDLQFRSSDNLLTQLRKTVNWYRDHRWL